MKPENIQEITNGFIIQGEQAKTDQWIRTKDNNPLYPPILKPIPIRGRLVGKAMGALINYKVLHDDEHPISVVTIRKDMLDYILVEEIADLVPDSDAEKEQVVAIIKELLAMLEMQFTANTIKDGGYFAFYWMEGWPFEGGEHRCSHVKKELINIKQDDDDAEHMYCPDCGVVLE